MATDQEVIDAEKLVTDNVKLEAALVILAAIEAGAEEINVIISRGEETISLSSLRASLGSGNADEVSRLAAIETHILTLVGASEAAIGSTRKELRDLVTAHDVSIAAT